MVSWLCGVKSLRSDNKDHDIDENNGDEIVRSIEQSMYVRIGLGVFGIFMIFVGCVPFCILVGMEIYAPTIALHDKCNRTIGISILKRIAVITCYAVRR